MASPHPAPNPALVTRGGARRLPRWALLMLVGAYLLPGVFGRDPWRNADLIAYGRMAAIAEGRSGWLAPTLGGVAGDTALLPHWLGAAAIRLLSPLVEPDVAARLPFVLLLAATLALVWYTSFRLARTEAAQPVAFAFGGEADPVDYARAIADGALLALIATLGLLQLGHETTPEMVQLFGASLFLWSLASVPLRAGRARAALVVSLVVLAASGAPSMASALGASGIAVCVRSRAAGVRRLTPWLAGAMAAAALVASAIGAWRVRAVAFDAHDIPVIARQWLWFLWPSWLLGLWTVWRWRRQLSQHHLAVPLAGVAVALGANIAMNGNDRALLLGLPGLAMLSAFALPTWRRSTAAAVDWFSMFFFTGAAITIWVIYAAMQTGVPAKPAANVARLAPGFVERFQPLELLLAVLASGAWIALVRWRTGRHREAVWKSMVLPAGGVALCWLLLMTLWLPLLDYVRSSRALVEHVAAHVPASACITAPGLSPVLVAALETAGGWRVDARAGADSRACEYRVAVVPARRPPPAPAGWQAIALVQGPRDRDDGVAVYRRAAAH